MALPDTAETAEELFALRFELQALADALLAGKSERWVDGFVPPATSAAHRARYAYAASVAMGRRVLDVSCGTGCGSHTMAAAGARDVVGLDIDPEAIRYARQRYHHSRATFLVADAETWMPDGTFDLVVSFETIEHLRRPDALLSMIARALAPSGQGLLSTPVALRDGERPTNPYHVQEWTEPAFVALLAAAGLVTRRTWYQGVRPTGELAGRIRRGIRRVLGAASPDAFGATGALHDSLAPYQRLRLRPKFQMHLVERLR